MGFLPRPIELSQVTRIESFDVRSLDPLETYGNLHISYTLAPRRWQVTRIESFEVRSLDPLGTLLKPIYFLYFCPSPVASHADWVVWRPQPRPSWNLWETIYFLHFGPSPVASHAPRFQNWDLRIRHLGEKFTNNSILRSKISNCGVRRSKFRKVESLLFEDCFKFVFDIFP